MNVLEYSNVVAGYDAIRVLHEVSLQMAAGEVVALLGRNGAGKSTTLKAAAGLVRVFSGSITFNGRVLTGLPAYRRAQAGIGYVPEDRRIFPELTVRENLTVAARRRSENGNQWSLKRIFELMPWLVDIQKRRGGVLSGGEQQMLTIARTLMGNPTVLLLDEPTEGLAPQFVRLICDLILELKRSGLAVLLAEESLHFIKRVADCVYVLESGEVRLAGAVAEVTQKEELKALLAL
ncbi:MAG: ABC transporter ATP-binding protein [Terriglobales bacterium]